jgi:hypothetical protein
VDVVVRRLEADNARDVTVAIYRLGAGGLFDRVRFLR